MSNNTNISLLSTSILPKEVIASATDSGLNIIDTAFIEVTLTNDAAVIQQIKLLESKNITAVFTSLNAISSVTDHLTTKPHWQVYCMDGVSKPAAINFFGEEALSGTAPTAKKLAEKIVVNNPTNDIVFFCGNKRLIDLPQTLQNANARHTEVEVYHTIKTPHLIKDTTYDAIAFFSPSAVESFFENNLLQSNVTAFTVGKITANKIGEHCSNNIVISTKPGKENLIKTVIEYYNIQHEPI